MKSHPAGCVLNLTYVSDESGESDAAPVPRGSPALPEAGLLSLEPIHCRPSQAEISRQAMEYPTTYAIFVDCSDPDGFTTGGSPDRRQKCRSFNATIRTWGVLFLCPPHARRPN